MIFTSPSNSYHVYVPKFNKEQLADPDFIADNFSMDNGSPFKDKSRKLIGGAGCPEIDCTPGTDDCNYKVRNPSIESCDPDPYYIQVAIC